jgi:hypothetical protein
VLSAIDLDSGIRYELNWKKVKTLSCSMML